MSHQLIISKIKPHERKKITLEVKEKNTASIWNCSEKGRYSFKIWGTELKKTTNDETFPQIIIHNVNNLSNKLFFTLKNLGSSPIEVHTSIILN